MITLTLETPELFDYPGLKTISVVVQSDHIDNVISGSIGLKVNDIPVEDFTTEDLGEASWRVTCSVYLMGPQLVKIEGVASDADETKTRVWVVDIATERYTDSGQALKAFSLDSLIRYFPSYTKARADKYSVYQQLMNVPGLEIDRIKESQHQWGRSIDPTRTHHEDPDWIFQCQLDVGEAFARSVKPNGEEQFEAPRIYGIKDYNRLELTGASSFLDFWARALPNRFTVTSEDILNNQLTPSTSIYELEFLGEISVPIPGHLYIWIHSVVNAIELDEVVTGAKIKIEGKGLNQIDQTEEIVILRDNVVATSKVWESVTKISSTDSRDDFYAEIVVYNFYPESKVQNEPIFRFEGRELVQWVLSDSNGYSFVQMTISGLGYLQDIISGQHDRYPLKTEWLLGGEGGHVSLDSFAVDPTSYKMYGIDDTWLYIWDRREVAAENLVSLNGSAIDPEVDFFVVDNMTARAAEETLLTSVKIEIDTPKGQKTIDSWYFSVIPPYDERVYLNSDGEFAGSAPFQTYNIKPLGQFGIAQRNFDVELEGVGTWIFELTVNFMDQTSETVRRPFQVLAKQMVAMYRIGHLFESDSPKIISCQEDGSLVVQQNSTIYKLIPMFDNFMIDFSTETISFREDFDSVEIRND